MYAVVVVQMISPHHIWKPGHVQTAQTCEVSDGMGDVSVETGKGEVQVLEIGE